MTIPNTRSLDPGSYGFSFLIDKLWNYTFWNKSERSHGVCGIKGQSKMFSDWTTPTSKVAGTISFRVVRFRGVTWWGWWCHALKWQLSFYFNSWIFWPSLSLKFKSKESAMNLRNSMQLPFHCLLWYLFPWVAGRSGCCKCIARLNAPPCYCTLSHTSWVPFTAQGHWTNLPSRERSHIPYQRALLSRLIIFLFPTWDMFGSWRVRKKHRILQPTIGPLQPQHHFRPPWFDLYPGYWLWLRWTCWANSWKKGSPEAYRKSFEQWKKPWLFSVYRKLYPVI